MGRGGLKERWGAYSLSSPQRGAGDLLEMGALNRGFTIW